MKKENILNRISLCVKEISSGTITSVNYSDRIEDDLGIDSMGATDMVFSLEDEFDIIISDSELLEIKTIDNIIALVMKKNKSSKN